MKTYQTDVIEREEIKLVGFSIIESLNNVMETKVIGGIRESLAKRMNEIPNRKSTGIYLVQIYPHEGEWTFDVPFQHVVACEVTSFSEVPKDMITYTVPSGRFIKIIHTGAESRIGETYDFINKTYGVRPIDIEYWNDINDLNHDDSEIEIYVPAESISSK